jgi:hypothetical protein
MANGDAIDVIGRYQRTGSQTKAEDRLTAALGALLMESPELANRVAGYYLAAGRPPKRTLVRPQRPIGGGKGWVDLELDVREPERALIWIEAKLRSGESGKTQFTKYKAALSAFKMDGPRRLMLLAPTSARQRFKRIEDWPGDGTTRDLTPYFTSWESLYLRLERPPRDKSLAWLHGEVLGYMAKQRLADRSSRVQREQRRAARKADDLGRIIEVARQALDEAGWNKPPRQKTKQDAPAEGYWESEYEPRRPGERPVRVDASLLEWNIALPYLSAGVQFNTDAGGPIVPLGDNRWASQLLAATPPARADPWDLGYYDDPRFVWVTCGRDLDKVIGEGTVEVKAKRLVEFIARAFEAALAHR